MEYQETLGLTWLDEAFAKGLVDELEAACCLAGYSQDDVRISQMFPYHRHPSNILTSTVSKLYEIIITWPNLTGKKPLLWYIEQAVVMGTPHVKYDLLLPKCTENEYRQKECIAQYPELAKKLGLNIGAPTVKLEGQLNTTSILGSLPVAKLKSNSLQSAESFWIENARIIYKELRLGREHLSLDKMADLIQKEMQKRHDAGEKGMTKRGGKKIPNANTIRRSALKNIP